MGAVANRRLPAMRAAEPKDAARINAIFDDVDVVLGPTLARSALPIGRYEGRGAAYTLNGVLRWMPFNGLWNHLGNPAAAVPAGFDAAGLPLSVQLVGAHGSEAAAAGALAAARDRPPVDRRAPAGLLTAPSAAGELLEIATEAARAAGELLRERFLAGGEQATGSKSTPTDVVSEADLAAERAIRAIITARAGPATRSSARRAARRRWGRACAGSSTRSTAR